MRIGSAFLSNLTALVRGLQNKAQARWNYQGHLRIHGAPHHCWRLCAGRNSHRRWASRANLAPAELPCGRRAFTGLKKASCG
jgi:hypothetical protein